MNFLKGVWALAESAGRAGGGTYSELPAAFCFDTFTPRRTNVFNTQQKLEPTNTAEVFNNTSFNNKGGDYPAFLKN